MSPPGTGAIPEDLSRDIDLTWGQIGSTESWFYLTVLCSNTISYVNLPDLPSVESYLTHIMLPKIRVVLVKAVHWPPKLIVSCVMPESSVTRIFIVSMGHTGPHCC